MNERRSSWLRRGALFGLILAVFPLIPTAWKMIASAVSTGDSPGFWTLVALFSSLTVASVPTLVGAVCGAFVAWLAAVIYDNVSPGSGSNSTRHGWRGTLSVACIACLMGTCELLRARWIESDSLPRRWVASIRNGSQWEGMPAVAAGLVIIDTRSGLAAFDTGTGALRWTAEMVPVARPVSTMSIVVDDSLACRAGSPVGCVSLRTGAVIWSAAQDSANRGAVASDGRVLYYGTWNHRVVARSMVTGAMQWIADLSPRAPFVTISDGVAIRGDTVYATDERQFEAATARSAGDLIALDRRTGRELWRFTTAPEDTSLFSSAPVLASGLALVTDARRGVRAIDLTTHKQAWVATSDGQNRIGSDAPPLVSGDTLFAASADGRVYAVNLRTGALRWYVDLQEGSLSRAAICANQIFGMPGGSIVVAFDRRTREVTRADVGDDDISSGVAVAGHSAYMVGERAVYAFRCE